MTPARLLSSPVKTTTRSVMGTGLDHLDDKDHTCERMSIKNGPGGEEMAALTGFTLGVVHSNGFR